MQHVDRPTHIEAFTQPGRTRGLRVQIEAAHVAQFQQHEPLGNVFDFGMKTGNLLVEGAVVQSVRTVQDG